MSRRSFEAACIQLTPGNEVAENLERLQHSIAAAAAGGAQFIALPEFATYLDRSSRSMRSAAARQDESVALKSLQDAARQHGVWLLIGSLVVLPDEAGEERLSNRSFLLTPAGEIAASYDKIHLFDARLSDGRVVGESAHYRGGGNAVVVETPLGVIGMSVCYDVRFPHLYRSLALAGAEVLVIPAAFTAETGRAHWETLLRARAIETGCFVLAPATCGVHPGDWHTYGHSMIIDPWGRVLASCNGEAEAICTARIELDDCERAREKIPSLRTNAAFSIERYLVDAS